MHLNGLRKADRLARQALDPGSQYQMFPLDLLGMAFARLMFIRLDMARVSVP
jgi:hypothetical protein